MDPNVLHDPVFQDLLQRHEVAVRKLRDAVIAMRSHYLGHHKRPLDETAAEKWRGAILGEQAAQRHEESIEAAAQLLRYAFELAPVNNCAIHLEDLLKLKAAHKERVARRMGYGKQKETARGIEEKVQIDGGPPITLVIKPKHWEYTDRAKNRDAGSKPAMDPEEPSAGY